MEKILSKIWLSNGDLIKEYICIWDTGSMETLVSYKVVSDLNPDILQTLKKKWPENSKKNFIQIR
jgi:hypothetical protein